MPNRIVPTILDILHDGTTVDYYTPVHVYNIIGIYTLYNTLPFIKIIIIKKGFSIAIIPGTVILCLVKYHGYSFWSLVHSHELLCLPLIPNLLRARSL